MKLSEVTLTICVGPPSSVVLQEQLHSCIAHEAVVPLFLTSVRTAVVLELGCITREIGICCGLESSRAKARGHSLWFADGGSGNDILLTSSYPRCCFLLASELSV